MDRKAAFTLIELLISVSIISLLIGISMYMYPQLGRNSRNTRRQVDAEQVKSALESYRNNDANAYYPNTLPTLVPGYVQSLPSDPRTRVAYGTAPSWYVTSWCDIPATRRNCRNYQLVIPLEPTGTAFIVSTPQGTVEMNVTPTRFPAAAP